ncbi:MAG: Glutamyl-tRNA(Gln) amidotransferase subunit C [Legionellaceae bacterium]
MSPEEVKKIAHLARLEILSDEELAIYTKNLTDIMHLMDQLNAINVDDIEPMRHPFPYIISQHLRDDRVTEINERDLLQKCSPSPIVEGVYLVSQVIE